jgi:hypothetical protein
VEVGKPAASAERSFSCRSNSSIPTSSLNSLDLPTSAGEPTGVNVGSQRVAPDPGALGRDWLRYKKLRICVESCA